MANETLLDTSSEPRLKRAAHDFVSYVAQESKPVELPEELPRVQTDTVSSSIATLYEQLRNTIDSTEQHLLRRNAIRRFLRRHVLVLGRAQRLGELLIRELIRSGYIPNDTFPERDVPNIENIIQKYISFSAEMRARVSADKSREIDRWSMALAAAEIERSLYKPIREEALLQYAFETLKERIRWEDDAVSPQDRDMQLYIALHRAIFKSDAMLIEYHLLSSYYEGDWQKLTAQDAAHMADFALKWRTTISQCIDHPSSARLGLQVRRMVLPMRTLMDTAIEHPDDAIERLTDRDTFIRDIKSVMDGYYKQNRRSQRRSTIRSILFIFITKMTLALALEIPYDLWINDSVKYLPLVVNVTFHPLLLFGLGTFVRFPGSENTKRVLRDLRATILEDKTPQPYFVRLRSQRSTLTQAALALFYILTFSISAGALVYGLTYFDFGLVGGGLFLFFLTLVTFVGIRLRTRARHYFVVRHNQTFYGTFFWFLGSPLVEIGRWFSAKFSQYNLFLFFFDIVLEAPLKTVTYGLEEWFRFARERTEEIVE